MTAWCEVRDLTKTYGGVEVLSDASISFEPGEVHGLVGANGAGKSSLVKSISGAIKPDGGTITIDGEAVTISRPVHARSRGIIAMPQEMCVVPDFTAVQNVLLGDEATTWGFVRSSVDRARAVEWLARFGLEQLVDVEVGEMLPGQQRLVMMARACASRARLLILDEPTAGLPPEQAAGILEAVRAVALSGVSVLYVSHHLNEVVDVCDRVTAMRSGKVIRLLDRAEVTKLNLVALLVDVPESVSGDAAVATGAEDQSAGARHPRSFELRLEGVSTALLRDVDLSVGAGEIVGLVGLLGSGVRDVVELVAGDASPDTGTATVNGVPVRLGSPRRAARHGIQYVSGHRGRVAFVGQSIMDNVAVAIRGRGGPLAWTGSKEERTSVAAALDELSVTAPMERSLSSLSGGNQQRVLVARSLVVDTELLVLEEPTVGVDIEARAQLWGVVRKLAATRAVLIASNDTEAIVALCDRVVCFKQGRVVETLRGTQVTEHRIVNAVS